MCGGVFARVALLGARTECVAEQLLLGETVLAEAGPLIARGERWDVLGVNVFPAGDLAARREKRGSRIKLSTGGVLISIR